jgi:archaellum component FlaF (FlaF/FlaG flagellin family)
MAYASGVQGDYGASGLVIHHESSDHSVLVPDTELLFTAQFHRAGPDLVLTGRDGQHHLIPGYFSSEHHPALVAPNGAHLSPDTVDLLAGSPTPGHYAQAQPTAPPDSIGKIEKVIGDVTVVRNGVTVALHVGDAVFKSDVVQTGASASCGISFPDGTVLNLVANTRMALNDYAYDANSNANGALFTLVEGTFAFVAGKVAHSGDMKIATPVATMGIRGTTGVVEEQPNAPATITANAGDHTYTFAVVPDIGTGITGVWDCYLTDAQGNIVRDANGNPIVLATIAQSGYVTYFTPQGLGQPPLVSTEPATNSQFAFEQEMLHQLFLTLNPANLNGNGNNGSSTTPPPFELPNPIPQLFEDNGKTFNINFPDGSSPTTPTTIDFTPGPTGPLTVVIWIASSPGVWSRGSNWLGGEQPTSPQEVEILTPIKVTADGNDSAAGLVIVSGATVNIVSGATLTILDFIHGGGTIQLNSSGSDPTLAIDGAVSLVGGGTINMIGTAGEDKILGVPGSHALLINVDYTIEGTGTIGGGDGNLTFENFGTVNANDGLLTIDTGNQVYNDGLVEATAGGTLAIKDSVANAGTVQADGVGAVVELSGTTFDNLFSVVAKNGGSVTFTNVAVTNEAVSATDPAGGTINATGGGTITFNGGSVANGNVMEATAGGILQLENITVTNSSAATASVDATSTLDLDNAAILGGTIDNAGTIVVTGLSELNGATVDNSGAITAGSGASLLLEGATLTNTATGTIEAVDGGAIYLEINNANTINNGLIDAVDGGTVTIDVNADGSSNHGTIEADNGTVVINNNIGGGGGGSASGGNFGTIEAINGGTVDINGGITNRAGATIEAVGSGSTVDFSEQPTENLGTIIADGGTVSLTGGYTNYGTIETADCGVINIDINNNNGLNYGTIEALHGTINITANISASNHGFLIAGAGGTINFDRVGTVNNPNGGNFGTVEAIDGGTIDYTGSNGGNNGTQKAVGAGSTITFDLAAQDATQNNNGGTMEALCGGAIIVNGGTLDNSFNISTNKAGTIEASSGGSVTVNGGTTNNSGGSIIEALSGGIVTFDDGATIHNSAGAAIAALCGGTINLNGTTVYNRNASIEADGIGAAIMLAGAIIIGGTLETSAHGIIETVADTGNTTFDGVTIAAGSNVQVSDDTTLTLQDTIDCNATVTNDGTITLVQGCHSSLIINGDITLAGSGTVVLSGDSDSIVGTGTGTNTLHNANTIEGSGTIGGDDLVFINQACGIVDADACGHTLVLDTGTTVINLGLLEATNGGTLEIKDSICNVGGTIAASGCGSVVDLVCATITGGTLETSCGGLIETTGTSTLLNVTITDGSTLEAGTGATFLLEGTTTVSDPVTFKGGGTFELSGDDAKIVGSGDNADLHNYATIAGAGTIGNCALSVTNECSGIIDATGCLTINLVPNTLTNYGLMEATGGGELTLLSTVSNSNVIAAYAGSTVYLDDTIFNSDCGQVIASGHCAVVDLFNATISGGTIASDCGGLIQTVAGLDDAATTSTFNGVTIGCDSDVKVADQTTLILEDGTTMFGGRLSIACSGVIDVEHGGNDGNGGATLDGVNVTDNGAIDIGDAACGAILTLDDGTTVTGHGAGTLTINAYNTLDVEHGGNDGNGGATLDGVNVTDNGAIDIGDVACGAILTLDDGTTITGHGAGTLTINAYNTVDVEHGGNDGCGGATLDGVHVTDNGALDIGDAGSGAILKLDDGTTVTGHGTGTLTINAYNTLDVEHGGNEGSGGATLDGVHVTDNGALDVGDAGSGAILTLDGGTTISGCGTMTINAGNTLDVDCGTTRIDLGGSITNNGTLEASNGGTLDIVSHVDNSSGTLEADSGGKLDVESDICGGTATIHGGTLEFDKSSNVSVTFCNGSADSPTYGTLVLGDPKDFHGTITGFDGTAAGACNSDTVELKGFCETSYSVQCCNGNEILTLHDGDRCVTLTFDDFNQSFKIEDVGGNTYIYDPPATGSKDAPSTTTATTTTTPTTTTTSAGSDHTAVPADTNGSGTDHAVTSAPGTPPTLSTGSFGASGNDSFTFHPNLGNDTGHNTGAQTTELAYGNIQGAAPALAPIAPEFHQEFAFDAIHQDAASIGAIVDQFHQMATNSTLLH